MALVSQNLIDKLPWQVVDDGKLPRSICLTCKEAVTEVSKFFDILATGQRRLRELLKEQVLPAVFNEVAEIKFWSLFTDGVI